ncbi:hypothetical protein PR048_017087 [Dryococelus australis]|uniref:Uncharacterized protein n=1 Tax=Dryococelus australis TaxID=614101 RepID=A0ABQ9H8K4_9NEOP|nr:hypothetical protein PR048_017087 [Dryococelus australis]
MQQFVNKMRNGETGHKSKSGALLDMLAEVASQKLHSDPAVQSATIRQSPSRLPNKSKRLLCCGKAANSTSVTLGELQNMSPNHLLKLFADFDGDEMKRTFIYTCRIDTVNCYKQFSSFGSENKAREQMKNHLQSHVSQLTAEGSLTKIFETVESQKRKANGEWKEISGGKKVQRSRKDSLQLKEPDENDSNIPNKKLSSPNTREPASAQKCINPDSVRAGKHVSCSIYREHNYTSLNLVAAPEKIEESIVTDTEYALIHVFDDSMAVAQYEEVPVYENSKTLEQEGTVSKPADDVVMNSTLAFHQGKPGSIPGWVTRFSQVGIMPDDAIGLRVFSGISHLPRPFILTPLHIHFYHPHRSQDLVVLVCCVDNDWVKQLSIYGGKDGDVPDPGIVEHQVSGKI